MRNWLRILPNLHILAGPTALVCCAVIVPSVAHAQHTKKPLDDVRKEIEEGEAVLVDVREESEWEAGHVAGAVFLPLSELSQKMGDREYIAELKKKLPRGKPLYTHCRSGARCVIAATPLRKLGFEVRPLKPGYEELVAAGFEQAKADEPGD